MHPLATRERSLAQLSEKKENRMASKTRRPALGPAVFLTGVVGVLVFFWWLLIYGHGIRVVS